MTRLNSFGAGTTLETPNGAVEILQPARAREGRLPAGRRAAVFAENPAREPAAPRRRRVRQDRGHRARWRSGIRQDDRRQEISFMPARVLLQDFTGVPCVVDLAAMRDGDRRARRRSRTRQSAAAGRARHRSLGAGRLLRPRRTRSTLNAELEYHAQPRALRRSCAGDRRVQQFPRRPARHRHRPSGQHRIPRARRVPRGRATAWCGVSRHARRHRLAYDDGQRPRRASAGASAASKPKRRCSASRARC